MKRALYLIDNSYKLAGQPMIFGQTTLAENQVGGDRPCTQLT